MKLLLTGLNHRTAPVEVREQLAFEEQALRRSAGQPEAAARAAGRHDSFDLQSRGDRGDGRRSKPTPRHSIEHFWPNREPWSEPGWRRICIATTAPDAIRHLFRVASSLDSMIVGEPQILGQLKNAYALAKERGAVSGFLDLVMTRAFNVAKRVRTETDIGESAVSVSYAAVELAREIFGSLEGKRVLVVGAGKMAESAARHLRRAGVSEILVTNRTRSRAEAMAEEFHGRVIDYDKFSRGSAGRRYRDRLERRAALHPDARPDARGDRHGAATGRCS